jgi:hypothetical protein
MDERAEVRSLFRHRDEESTVESRLSHVRTVRGLHRGLLLAALVLMGVAAFVAPASGTTPSTSVDTGNDISFPQCGSTFPGGQGFGVVGINDGLPDSLNPCFGPDPSYVQSELYWAVSTATSSAA